MRIKSAELDWPHRRLYKDQGTGLQTPVEDKFAKTREVGLKLPRDHSEPQAKVKRLSGDAESVKRVDAKRVSVQASKPVTVQGKGKSFTHPTREEIQARKIATATAGLEANRPAFAIDKAARQSAVDAVKTLKFRQIAEPERGNVLDELEKYSPKGRRLRKAFERPRPDLPSDAQENRSRKPVTATLPPDLIDEMNARCRELEVDRTAFIEAAIRLALKPI